MHGISYAALMLIIDALPSGKKEPERGKLGDLSAHGFRFEDK